MIITLAALASLPFAICASLPQQSVEPLALHVTTLPTPTAARSRLPHLWTGADGRLGLSWVEEKDEGSERVATLKASRLGEKDWSAPVDIARGSDWFVNWADFPSIAALDAKHLFGHFLQKSGEGSYDYHVQLVRSTDGGGTWSAPTRLHTHAGPGEHGFVSIAPLSAERAAAVWLDGRNAGVEHDEGGHGAMCLYARTLDSGGGLGQEVLLDERVCDCCPTAALRAPDGALVVAYRDRSPGELRDISVLRWKEGGEIEAAWSSGDGWKIAGCPVNGPVLDLAGGRIGLAWFTLGSAGRGSVLCAFSEDGGRSFSAAVELAGARAQGRIDALFDAGGQFVVAWLEADSEGAQWRVARVAPGREAPASQAIVAAASGRDSGLARLGLDRDGVVFASTNVEAEPRVELRRLKWD